MILNAIGTRNIPGVYHNHEPHDSSEEHRKPKHGGGTMVTRSVQDLLAIELWDERKGLLEMVETLRQRIQQCDQYLADTGTLEHFYGGRDFKDAASEATLKLEPITKRINAIEGRLIEMGYAKKEDFDKLKL